ncbi:MAG: peptidylprolyl isomerase [bacterium]|nr:peptidylprolyl isomerase [bacterium]
MLDFFRRHAVTIALSIVVFFVGTMFTGMFFFSDVSDQEQEKQMRDPSNAVARYGTDIMVPRRRYFNQLQQALYQAQAKGNDLRYMDPELVEIIKLNALNRAIEDSLLYKAALSQELSVTKRDLKYSIIDIMQMYDLPNKSALRQFLAERGIVYKQFESNLMGEILVQKMKDTVRASISVSDQDVERFYTHLDLSHILIRPRMSAEAQGEDREIAIQAAYQKAEEISAEFRKGQSFRSLATQYSEDEGSSKDGGALGVVHFGQLVSSVEDAAYSLSPGELSRPVESPFGVHLLMVNKRLPQPHPEDFDLENEKQRLASRMQEQALRRLMGSVAGDAELEILEPDLVAAKAKLEGNVELAKGSYQTLISQAPSNPVPHLLLARLLMTNSDQDAAVKELKKADVLLELTTDVLLPSVNMELAQYYRSRKSYRNMQQEYAKAIERATGHIPLLQQLASSFEKLGDAKRLKTVNDLIQFAERMESEAASQNAVTKRG